MSQEIECTEGASSEFVRVCSAPLEDKCVVGKSVEPAGLPGAWGAPNNAFVVDERDTIDGPGDET